MQDQALALAAGLAERYAALPLVEAVALAGSRTSAWAQADSDIDLYVYARQPLAVSDRAAIARSGSARCEIDNRFFELGDEWIDAATAIGVDVMFRETAWIEDQMDRVIVRHEASVGYSTCFWHNVRASRPLFDRNGWFARLHEAARVPYPEGLRAAIVAKNHPLLRGRLCSFLGQIERAARRGDLVSVQHRTSALLASFFDVLFAINREPHPGEKRLLAYAQALCPLRPADLSERLPLVLGALPDGLEVCRRAASLLDSLDALVAAQGFTTDVEHRSAG
jgi:hypothetical protein